MGQTGLGLPEIGAGKVLFMQHRNTGQTEPQGGGWQRGTGLRGTEYWYVVLLQMYTRGTDQL